MHRLLITLPLLAAPVGAAGAAEPRADWHVVAGGGGESAAGRFAIRGTAAQHEAEEVPLCSADGGLACAAPRFQVIGGFWVPGSVDPPDTTALFRDGFEP